LDAAAVESPDNPLVRELNTESLEVPQREPVATESIEGTRGIRAGVAFFITDGRT
jgi:hypothetical protein